MYRIKELRKMRKWNQKEVAEAIYTTQQQYSRIELGKTDISDFTLETTGEPLQCVNRLHSRADRQSKAV